MKLKSNGGFSLKIVITYPNIELEMNLYGRIKDKRLFLPFVYLMRKFLTKFTLFCL